MGLFQHKQAAKSDPVAADACQHCGTCYYCTHGLYNICERLAFTAHVYGTVWAPRTDFTAALAGVVLRKIFNTSLGDLIRRSGRREPTA